MTKENCLRKELIEELIKVLKENEKPESFLIIPDADRWDIAIICNSEFIAGIELKNSLTQKEKLNVGYWYSKHGSCTIEKKQKQELSMGTIRKFGDTWYSQNEDPFGQATTYYLYSESSSKPKNVLAVEVNVEKEEEKKEKYEYRVSNITQWVNKVEEIKQNQEQLISPQEEIKGQEREGNLNEIAKEIYNCLKKDYPH